MSHHFYLQNGARRSAQAFPISIAPGAKFSESKETFGDMLGVPPEQILRMTTADGHIVLPGQTIPDEPLILEVEKRAFDKLTGAGAYTPGGSMVSSKALGSVVLPLIIVFLMFAGWGILLGGLASASAQCQDEYIGAGLIARLFPWGTNSPAYVPEISLKFSCGLSLSLFWFIIMLEFVMCILPAIILLVKAGSFSADTKGSWAYIITCTLNILTALLCIMAFIVVPGAYFAQVADFVIVSPDVQIPVPSNYVKTIQTLAAGVIILLVANFAWIYTQACGKMIPEDFMCMPPKKAPEADVGAMTPGKAATVVSV